MAKTTFKSQPEIKSPVAKKESKNTVDFLVKVKFNGYKRGQVVRDVEKTKAARWALKERGDIL